MKTLSFKAYGLNCHINTYKNNDGSFSHYSGYVEGIEIIEGTYAFDYFDGIVPGGITCSGFSGTPKIGWDTYWGPIKNMSINDVILWTKELAKEVALFLDDSEKMSSKNKITDKRLFELARGYIDESDIDLLDMSFLTKMEKELASSQG